MPAQPPPSRLSFRDLLSLPYRLCNPPPAAGKVRSCGVTPILDVRLEDVLARRHLPPIGLKDLEEYLLYVERTPENLYFILWLKDYTARYHAWVQREKSSLISKKDKLAKSHTPPHAQKFPVPPTPDPALAMFYLRAKQTFFTPNGEYELNIPSDILAPFHSTPQDPSRSSLWAAQSIHPDPAVFSEVAMEARIMLNESLKRFVRAAYTNVGSQRAICGITAGCVFSLVSGVVPLILTTGHWNIGPHTRLIRLAAFPGLWFGLTVLIASLQGICLMIYFFGDLRQLRRFELARPTISRPIAMPTPSHMSSGSTLRGPPLSIPTRVVHPLSEKSMVSPTVVSADSPTSSTPPTRSFPPFSTTSLTESCGSCESDGSSVACNEIDISPAVFDDVPAPEGPATASCLHRPEYRLSPSSITYAEPAHVRPSARTTGISNLPFLGEIPDTVNPRPSRRSLRSNSKGSTAEYGPTAGFIPSDYVGSTTSLSATSKSLRSQRSACYFDFDSLPATKGSLPHQDGISIGDAASLPVVSPIVVDPSALTSSKSSSTPSLTAGISSLFGRTQYKCNQCNPPELTSPMDEQAKRLTFFTMLIPSFTKGVPAFATPLTRVQSPVVKRAQWEVVVRAGLVAAALAGGLTGIVVGVVP